MGGWRYTPAPCGVLVLKFCLVLLSFVSEICKFPSPCGVLVLKFDTRFDGCESEEGFPSPCGVLVLKYG